jgi:methylphosphotriester-DNA--protein-cysteine methyltransferase
MSSYYFCKTFKGYGAEFYRLLVFEVGFQPITHFNRIFKRHVGKSPSEYRQSLPKTA